MLPPITKSEPSIVALQAVSGADGTSNTIMVGESLGSSYGTPRDIGFAWIASGSHPSFMCVPDSRPNVHWWDWSSNHAGGVVNFVMGDGSIRPIRPTGRDTTSPSGGSYPQSPLTASERAFWAISGYTDADATQADGITN